MTLQPLSDREAVIAGLGRGKQETVRAEEIDGASHLYYWGLVHVKLRDSAAYASPSQPRTNLEMARMTAMYPQLCPDTAQLQAAMGPRAAAGGDAVVLFALGFAAADFVPFAREIAAETPVLLADGYGIPGILGAGGPQPRMAGSRAEGGGFSIRAAARFSTRPPRTTGRYIQV